MTYEEFLKEIRQAVHDELGIEMNMMEYYPAGYSSDNLNIMKIIREANQKFFGKESFRLLDDILILKQAKTEEVTRVQRVAIKQLYREYADKGIDEAMKRIHTMFQKDEQMGVDVERIERRLYGTYEEVRDQLVLKPMNYELHKRELQDCVYRKIADIALVLYHVIGKKDNSQAISRLNHHDIERWNMSEEQVLQDTLEHLVHSDPAMVVSLRSGKPENLLEGEFQKSDLSFLNMQILMSTETELNGAVSLFYPGVVEKMMKIMGGPFIAVIMNISDVLIFETSCPFIPASFDLMKEDKYGERISRFLFLCNEDGIFPGEILDHKPDGTPTIK